MFLTLGLVAALSATASAEDTFSMEGVLQARPDAPEALGAGLGLRAGLGALFASAEGRALGQGAWIGRGTAGLDLFGRRDSIDLTLGAFAGAVGGLEGPSAASSTFGVEVGAGVHLGRLELRYRRALGLRGPLSTRLAEDELRAGLRLGEEQRLSVFGQGVRLRAGEATSATGLGVGLAVVF